MAPGGTSLPLMLLLCTKLSYPNTNAEWEKPEGQQPETPVSSKKANESPCQNSSCKTLGYELLKCMGAIK